MDENKMKNKKWIWTWAAIGVALAVVIFWTGDRRARKAALLTEATEEMVDTTEAEQTHYKYGIPPDNFEVEEGVVGRGQNLSTILAKYGVSPRKIHEISQRCKDVFDLRKIRSGQKYTLFLGKDSLKTPEFFIYESNKALAGKRAARALSIIKSGLGPGADVQLPAPTVKVYTWQDVVAELEGNGTDTAIVSMVRNVVATTDSRRVNLALRNLPFYASVIQPVLAGQRMMKCSYSYERDHVMTPDEAVEAYYSFKPDYIAGKKRFSDGDSFNLFATVKDKAELDTITEMAYRQITAQPGYDKLRFAPYVANRMALLSMRRGVPDPRILAPFIDYTDRRVPAS